MLSLEVECMINWEPSGKPDCCQLSICVIIIKESRGSLYGSCYQLNSPNLTEGWGVQRVRRGTKERGLHVCASWRKWIVCVHTSLKQLTAIELVKSSSLYFEFVLTKCYKPYLLNKNIKYALMSFCISLCYGFYCYRKVK